MSPGYELIKKIAGGGMGEVFVARRTGAGNFEKRVALKMLLPHLSDTPELVQRFHDEARLAARMHHPNIVEIFDVGEADGRPFIAMQLVDGVTLSRLIKDLAKAGQQVPLPLVRLIATGLCEALTYAHTLKDGHGKALQLVHRDVTPGNVLVSRNGAVLLTDFGIARVHDSARTEPGVLKGKAAYLAPEQVRRTAPLDARADVYSLGVTLYELLSGTSPFKRAVMKDSIAAVMEGKYEPIETVRADVTPRMAKAIAQAMKKDPAQRFASARLLRDAFVDGPTATSPELAEFVQLACPDALAAPSFDEEGASGPGTRSVVMTPADPSAVTLPGRSKAPWIAGAVVLALGIALLFTPSPEGERVGERESPPIVLPPHSPAVVEPVAVPAPPIVVEEKLPSPQPSPPQGEGVRKRPTARPMKVGYLTADASPFAEVMLNGKVIETTPFVRLPIQAGRHQLVFKGPNGKTVTRSVLVEAGEVTAVRVDF